VKSGTAHHLRLVLRNQGHDQNIGQTCK
jgi:hypothetical protein